MLLSRTRLDTSPAFMLASMKRLATLDARLLHLPTLRFGLAPLRLKRLPSPPPPLPKTQRDLDRAPLPCEGER